MPPSLNPKDLPVGCRREKWETSISVACTRHPDTCTRGVPGAGGQGLRGGSVQKGRKCVCRRCGWHRLSQVLLEPGCSRHVSRWKAGQEGHPGQWRASRPNLGCLWRELRKVEGFEVTWSNARFKRSLWSLRRMNEETDQDRRSFCKVLL